MYSVSVREKFIARHFLPHEIGREQTPHSHHYFVEVRAYGENLDRKGFLIDIVTLRHALDNFLRQLNDKLLNDLEEFLNKTPSLENIAQVLWLKLVPHLKETNVDSVRVTVWEEEHIYGSFQERIN